MSGLQISLQILQFISDHLIFLGRTNIGRYLIDTLFKWWILTLAHLFRYFFFLTCKFHMPGLFIMPYFGHGKCSVWGFSVLKLTLFRMKRRQKGPPTSFSSVTSSNVGIRPQNFLTFSFNHFAALVQRFKFSTNASLKLLNLNEDHSSKKAVFLVKSL